MERALHGAGNPRNVPCLPSYYQRTKSSSLSTAWRPYRHVVMTDGSARVSTAVQKAKTPGEAPLHYTGFMARADAPDPA